jgi:hypothetical protein
MTANEDRPRGSLPGPSRRVTVEPVKMPTVPPKELPAPPPVVPEPVPSRGPLHA